jgi:putative isomerase
MIARHLLNASEMRAPHGFRSLSIGDPAFNLEPYIAPYSNWRGPVWINANYVMWMGLRKYGYAAEAKWLALTLAEMLHRDISQNGSMHENYDGESGVGLAPTSAESPGGIFAGFVGWNMLALDMLQCEVTHGHCDLLEVPDKEVSPGSRQR